MVDGSNHNDTFLVTILLLLFEKTCDSRFLEQMKHSISIVVSYIYFNVRETVLFILCSKDMT